MNITREYSYSDVVAIMTDPKNEKHWREADSFSSHRPASYDEVFYGNAEWSDSVDYILNGWNQAVPRLSVEATQSLQHNMRPTMIVSESGSDLDMGAFMSGELQCMGEVIRTKRPSPVVRIGFDRTVNYSIPADHIEAIGKQVLMLVESFRIAGVPAELWACESIYGTYGHTRSEYHQRVCVQETHRPMDTGRIAYWVAHPCVLRRTFFALQELESQEIREAFGIHSLGSYGRCYPDAQAGEFDEWCPSAEHTIDEITAWVQGVMSRRIH